MTRFWGTGCSDGVATGKVLKKEPLALVVTSQPVADRDAEVAKLDSAISQLLGRMRRAYERALKKSAAEAELYESYIVILEDDVFFDTVRSQIVNKYQNAKKAVDIVRAQANEVFLSLEDAYMRERFSDINCVCDDLLLVLDGLSDSLSGAVLTEPTIIVADTLTPSSTIHLDKKYLAGFVTQEGSPTSHAVILARTLGIPAIIGAAGTFDVAKTGNTIAISGYSGEIVLEPDEGSLADFYAGQQEEERRRLLYAAEPLGTAHTTDGRAVRICVNTGDLDSAAILDPARCDGVGLLRTEFLYMQHNGYPDEQTQTLAYSSVVERMGGKEVVIRTLDIGGDKQLDYFGIQPEENPFLGFRAIRICIERPEIFKTQLRAILRASAFGKVKIMFPMIVAMEEWISACQFVEECKVELRQKGIPFDEDIPVGMMVETPATVLMADDFAQQAAFFSIGTNDLVQYLTATDRVNQAVSYLYDNINIGVLKAIRTVGQAAENAGIPLSVCGEMAASDEMIPFLIGCGVTELSVSAPLADKVRYIVRRTSYAEATRLAKETSGGSDAAEARKLLKKSAVTLF